MKPFFIAAVVTAFAFAENVFITVDQFGYRPSDTKVAVLRDPQVGFDSALSYTPGNSLQVVESSSGKVVFTGTPALHNGGVTDSSSGDKIWWFDFSAITQDGTYYIQDASEASKKSFPFQIREDIYNDVLKAAVRML